MGDFCCIQMRDNEEKEKRGRERADERRGEGDDDEEEEEEKREERRSVVPCNYRFFSWHYDRLSKIIICSNVILMYSSIDFLLSLSPLHSGYYLRTSNENQLAAHVSSSTSSRLVTSISNSIYLFIVVVAVAVRSSPLARRCSCYVHVDYTWHPNVVIV